MAFGQPPPPGGGVDISAKCYRIWEDCQVIIDTWACANGLCPAEVKIYKSRQVKKLEDHCDGCAVGESKTVEREFNLCPGAYWPPPPKPAGTHLLIKCRKTTVVCTLAPPAPYDQTLDFNCGPTAIGSSEQASHAKRMAACMEKAFSAANAPGGPGGDSPLCAMICDLANMTNAPGGGPDGEPGGIGNKEDCKPPAQTGYWGSNPVVGLGVIILGGTQTMEQELCEDELSKRYQEALGDWLDMHC